MTKWWKNGFKGLSSFRSLSWLSEETERGSIHVREVRLDTANHTGILYRATVCDTKCFICCNCSHLDTTPQKHFIIRPQLLRFLIREPSILNTPTV